VYRISIILYKILKFVYNYLEILRIGGYRNELSISA